MMYVMGRDMNDTLIIINMKEIFKMEKLMVKEFIVGKMEKFMMESGKAV